jgi:beta-1,4-mannosyl-glycoprotein beta-1,4-N-acetylglucosaminyltransferase
MSQSPEIEETRDPREQREASESFSPKLVVDCFIFYNELELLKYRLTILNDVVDFFILVEAAHTFTGNKKELEFGNNRHLFKQFLHKIIHVVVYDAPFKYPNICIARGEQWENEYFQRNCIHRGLDQLKNQLGPNDIIIIADVDEIPDPRIIADLKSPAPAYSHPLNNVSLEMDLYYYNLLTRLDIVWPCCKAVAYEHYIKNQMSCQSIRAASAHASIKKGGWHLSYFGDASFISNKINNFSHQELNQLVYSKVDAINDNICKGADLFSRNITIHRVNLCDNPFLPPRYDTLMARYCGGGGVAGGGQ